MTDARLHRRAVDPPSPSGSFGGISGGASSRSAARPNPSLESDPTPAAMRAARRRWASGVAVATTAEGEAKSGATISSFLPLSLEPPLVAISLESQSRMALRLQQTGIVAVSVLDRAHEFLSDRFSGYGPQPDPDFTGIRYQVIATGAPVLIGALAWFDCEIREIVPTGDHILVIAQALAIGVGEDTDDPLLNYEGAYRRIEGA